jgi:hypothetical protein
MLHVSIFVEGLRSQPRAMFWAAALIQAAIWWLLPSIFYSAPPSGLPEVLAVGHEFQLGSDLGPPLAFWLAEIAHTVGGITFVYLLSQVCVVVTYWAVFMLGRSIVGIQQAAMAVLLMVGVSVMTLPSPDFGPSMLGMALSALVMLHFWRALGEGKRHYWFVLSIDLGLLLLTTYAGLILLAALIAFTWGTERGRAALQTLEPWFAAIAVGVLLFPHLMWLYLAGQVAFAPVLERLHSAEAANTNFLLWIRLFGGIAVVHAGLLVLIGIASSWGLKSREPLPVFVRPPVDEFAQRFVYFFAIAPALVATLLAAIVGASAPIGGTSPHVVLSSLAIVVLAGDVIAIHRQRMLGLVWSLMLLLPPIMVIAVLASLPWIAGIELRVAQPANEMGRFFSETFERRTGKPLEIVSGDERLADLVALASRSRPSVYDYAAPARTPWITDDEIRRKGIVLIWMATDTAGTPPQDIRARFPDLVAEVPRAFAHAIQGRLPLVRIGWGMMRPQGAAQRQ